MSKKPYLSMGYRVDWLALTISDSLDQISDKFELLLLESLGYNVEEFQEIPGKYFYNSGLTLGGYVNIYYNDVKKDVYPNSSMSRNYVWTGQGCTDLAQKIDCNWNLFFKSLLDLKVKITRIDLALDDYHAIVDMNKMERKLKLGEYRSSKKSYNVIKEADVNGEIKGHSIYVGARSRSAKGCYFLRCYNKYAQYKSKAQIPPEKALETGKWQRYEISYTKKKAHKVVERLGYQGQTISSIFQETARDIVEFLVRDKKQSNKTRWKTCKWWEDFLDGAKKAQLGDPEIDVDLGRTLKWIRISVLPSIKLMQDIFQERNLDFYDLMKKSEVGEYSKKMNRLQNKAREVKMIDLMDYIEQFEEGRYG